MGSLSNMTERELLVQISTKLEGVKEDINELKGINPRVDELDRRVTKIETHNVANSRITAFVTGIVASLITLFAKYFIER